MDLLSLIGVVLALLMLAAGTMLHGSSILSLWNLAAFIIVFGGTAAAVMLHTPMPTVRRALSIVRWVFRPPHVHAPDLISRIVGWSEISRRQGLLGLEPSIESESDPLMKKGLQLLVDGTEPEVIRSVLEVEISTREHTDMDAAKMFENAGVYSPTMGILGAVMGLIAVMQNLADPSKLGEGIAAAFVATIYGIATAYLFMTPMSNKIKSITRSRSQLGELLVEGLVSIAQGDNPRHIENKLQGFLP
ncbi:MAG: flagellar motor protein [Rhodanobacteraceae bacterium]